MARQLTTEAALDMRVPARWLTIVRAIWLALVFCLLALVVVRIGPYFQRLSQVCAGGECFVLELSPQEANLLQDFGLSMEFYAGYQLGLEMFLVIVFTALAGLIFWRRSESWTGVLVSLALVFLGIIFFSGSTFVLVEHYPGLELLVDILASLSGVFFVLLLYLFPDGRFVPGWTRIVAVILTVTMLIEAFLSSRGQQAASGSVRLVIVVLGGLIVGVVAQIYRYYRVSTPTQRQQTKWIMFGLVAMFAGLLTWAFLAELFPLQPGPARLAFDMSLGIQYILIGFFPLSMAFSILRYRLWDIDLVIRRTLLYTALTGLIALFYAGSIVLLQSLFRVVTGQESQLAVVISTLAIAALFAPLRRQIQAFIDRRFYRSNYDAQRILEAFGDRVRDEVDMDRLHSALLSAVRDTIQPAHVALWINEGD